MVPIQYIGVDQLTTDERIVLDKLSAEYYDKIERSLKNLTTIIVHIKEYKKEAAPEKKEERGFYGKKLKRKKYDIHIKVVAPTRIFEEKHAADWDFARTLHKAFKNIEREIQHKLHTDNQRNKAYG